MTKLRSRHSHDILVHHPKPYTDINGVKRKKQFHKAIGKFEGAKPFPNPLGIMFRYQFNDIHHRLSEELGRIHKDWHYYHDLPNLLDDIRIYHIIEGSKGESWDYSKSKEELIRQHPNYKQNYQDANLLVRKDDYAAINSGAIQKKRIKMLGSLEEQASRIEYEMKCWDDWYSFEQDRQNPNVPLETVVISHELREWVEARNNRRLPRYNIDEALNRNHPGGNIYDPPIKRIVHPHPYTKHNGKERAEAFYQAIWRFQGDDEFPNPNEEVGWFSFKRTISRLNTEIRRIDTDIDYYKREMDLAVAVWFQETMDGKGGDDRAREVAKKKFPQYREEARAARAELRTPADQITKESHDAEVKLLMLPEQRSMVLYELKCWYDWYEIRIKEAENHNHPYERSSSCASHIEEWMEQKNELANREKAA